MNPVQRVLHEEKVLSKIFENLDLLEQQQIKVVCKPFKAPVDAIRVQELVVKPYLPEPTKEDDRPDYDRFHNWYGTYEFADQRNFIPRLPIHPAPLNAILQGLQRLRLEQLLDLSIFLKLSTHLANLLHLEILFLDIPAILDAEPDREGDIDRFHVNLPKLRVLCVQATLTKDDFTRLMFDSPLLTHICFGDPNAIIYVEPSNPESVLSLEFDWHWRSIYSYRSVERVICNNVVELAGDLIEKLSDPERPVSIIDHLILLDTIQELHLFAKPLKNLNQMLNEKQKISFEAIDRRIQDARRLGSGNLKNLMVYMQGVCLNWVLNPALDPTQRSAALGRLLATHPVGLHYEHKAAVHRLSACRFAVLDQDLINILKLKPNLAAELGTFFGSKYPFIVDVQINVPNLIPRLLMELSGSDAVGTRLFRLNRELRGQENRVVKLPRNVSNLPPDREADLTPEEHKKNSIKITGMLSNLIRNKHNQAAYNDLLELAHKANLIAGSIRQQLRRLQPAFDLRCFRGLHPRLYGLGESWILLFLGNFQHLVALDLSYSGFSQSFFNRLVQMPGLTTSLNRLCLIEQQPLVSDLQFLYRFRRLNCFWSNLLIGEQALQFISRLNCPGTFILTCAVKEDQCTFEFEKYRDRKGLVKYDYERTFKVTNVKYKNLTFEGLTTFAKDDSKFPWNLQHDVETDEQPE